MARRSIAAKIAAVILGFAAFFLYFIAPAPIDEDELARLVTNARPSWTSYQEDIKAQLGARAAAQWQGGPTRAWTEKDAVFIEFRLKGPWADRSNSVPILLRDPSLEIYHPSEITRDGPLTIYRFDVPNSKGRMIAWVEVHYPHHGGTPRRMVPDDPPA